MKEKSHKLHVLKSKWEGCHRCELSQGRYQIVFGEGNINCDILICGQSPASQEYDEQGFLPDDINRDMLKSILEDAGIDLERCYLLNALLCPCKGKPETDWIDSCRPRLWEQIDIISPKVVVSLGAISILAVTGNALPIWQMRKAFTKINDKTYFYATYHPASFAYKPDSEIITTMIDDFVKVRKLVSRMNYFEREFIYGY